MRRVRKYTKDVVHPKRDHMHCAFRFEMEHLLARAGFEIEALYGDFLRRPLTTESSEMVWVTRKP